MEKKKKSVFAVNYCKMLLTIACMFFCLVCIGNVEIVEAATAGENQVIHCFSICDLLTSVEILPKFKFLS